MKQVVDPFIGILVGLALVGCTSECKQGGECLKIDSRCPEHEAFAKPDCGRAWSYIVKRCPSSIDVHCPECSPCEAIVLDLADAVEEASFPLDAMNQETNVETEVEHSQYFWVKVVDSPDNPTLSVCFPGNSPGADIDAVGLRRGKKTKGFLEVVYVDLNKDIDLDGNICANDFQNPDDVIGMPDAQPHAKFVSLNGGWLIGRFEGGVSIDDGDTIVVYEGGGGIGAPEKYSVYIAKDKEGTGGWLKLAEDVQASSEVLVNLP